MHKFLEDSVVECKSPIGIIMAILNVVWPGCGTFWSGILGEGKGCHPKWQMEALVIGIAQGFSTCIFVGFLWSWYWAYLIFKK